MNRVFPMLKLAYHEFQQEKNQLVGETLGKDDVQNQLDDYLQLEYLEEEYAYLSVK